MTATSFHFSTHDVSVPSADNGELHAVWSAPESPKATVVLVHGLGEHSARLQHVADRLNEAGYAVAQFDLRGHGRSPGTRGLTPFGPTLDDIEAMLDHAETEVPDVPRFLYGHSMGGLLALTYVLRRRTSLDGVVCTSAGLRSPVLDQKLKILLAKVLGSLLPSVTIPSGLDDAGLSRDPAVLEAYRADPLVHDKISLALGKDGAAAADYAIAHAAEFDRPLLMIHGGADPITYARGSEEFAALVPGDVTLKVYDDLMHETHNEPEAAEVLDDIVAWLDAHC